MDTQQSGIITLIKSAITQTALPLPDGFNIQQAMPQIKRHSLVTLVYDGAARCGISTDEPAMQQLFRNYLQFLLQTEGQQRGLDRLFRAFSDNQIDYLPLKGCQMRPLYPKPEMRIMADADVLIRLEQYPKIEQILTSLGFVWCRETGHEIVWKTDGLYLELHKCLVPKQYADEYAFWGDGWDFAANKDGYYHTMSPENEWLFLFTHFAKHYREGGIGCRHATDLWVFLRNHPDLNTAIIEERLKEMGLLAFYSNIRDLLTMWFEDGKSNEKVDLITEYIFASGNWGDLRSHAVSQVIKRSTSSSKMKWMFLKFTLFPSRETMAYSFPVLKKIPILLPIFWMIRFFQKIFIDKNAIKRGKTRFASVTDKTVEERREALRYVGFQ